MLVSAITDIERHILMNRAISGLVPIPWLVRERRVIVEHFKRRDPVRTAELLRAHIEKIHATMFRRFEGARGDAGAKHLKVPGSRARTL
jgi:DNA-binding GntR family transcriptional regulator